MAADVLNTGTKSQENIDGHSAPPKGFEHDQSNELKAIQDFIVSKYPTITDIQVFHQGVDGDIMVRFLYNHHPTTLQFSFQELLNTLTNQRYGELPHFLQSLSPRGRGIFNKIIKHIGEIEKVKQTTHAALENLLEEQKTA